MAEIDMRLLFVSGLVLLSFVIYPTAYAENLKETTSMNISLPKEPLLERWINYILVLDADESGLMPLASFREQLASPFQESKAGLGFFIKHEANPHYISDMAQWYVSKSKSEGMDLLYCKYIWQERRVRLYESANVIVWRIGFDPNSAPIEQSVKSLVATVVNTQTEYHNWVFDYPADLESNWQGRLISTRGVPPVSEIFSRHDRADILLLHDSIMLIFYKKIEQLMEYRKDDAWFSSRAR